MGSIKVAKMLRESGWKTYEVYAKMTVKGVFITQEVAVKLAEVKAPDLRSALLCYPNATYGVLKI